MLCYLNIRNFIIARAVELDVRAGLTVLSGETGAGKSIVLDALMLLAGGRADSSQVRHGEDKADLSATFMIRPDSPAGRWLREQELWQEGECVVRRVLTADGRSRAFINATSVPVAKLRELGDLVLRIHAQHEHQRLMKPDQHLAILDAYAQPGDSLTQVAKLYREWREVRQRHKNLQMRLEQDSAEQKLMAYQLEELNALDLQADELASLEQEQKSLSHAEALLQSASEASQILNAENSEQDLLSLLRRATLVLEPHAELNETLSNALSLLHEAQVQLDEAHSDLLHFAEDFQWDPERLAAVEKRLSHIYEVARKHHCAPEALFELQASLSEQLGDLDADESTVEELAQREMELAQAYQQAAEALSKQRQAAGAELAEALAQQLHRLNMPHAQVVCRVIPQVEKASAQGIDDVELCLSANPGQPVQPLHKAASGGELSRIALAIQVVAQQTQQAPTLFFDEVDVGISGATAEEVGRLIRQLSDQSQILCITHLPQVASFGHQHWLVEKRVAGQETLSEIRNLDPDDRTHEVARLISGTRVTDTTLAHARDLLAAPMMH
ncbi:DNA repair protein RecN [Natronospirillum operosum]|uniref:DNA repair protein RecN n=1 Tax=Natronospirillum operosum TaxID=2759953 RepID=A0A4Z0W6S7_9GAMM|nr:DNA repair protein RecN [Natronospirillum operosum]TGG92049.1 DNA repair protein RecN [Natronospirillum operosum]